MNRFSFLGSSALPALSLVDDRGRVQTMRVKTVITTSSGVALLTADDKMYQVRFVWADEDGDA